MAKKYSVQERAALVDAALKSAESMGFSLAERAAMLGYQGDVGLNPAFLRRQLIDLREGKDVEERSEQLILFDQLLQKVGHTNTAAKRTFIEQETFKCLAGSNYKDWMKRGDLEDMKHGVEQLMYMST